MTITMAEKPRLLMPGMAGLAPGVERYRVTGGAVTAILLGAGDRLQVIDPEGCQPGEVGQMDGHQKRLPATVVRFPHYDPDKERVRS